MTRIFQRNDTENVAVLGMDDGKANTFTAAWAGELHAHLAALESDACQAVVLAGREGRFCAGFDLSIMAEGPDAALPVMRETARALMRLYTLPKPLVIACTGHAIAGGAVLLMTGDLRLGADADYRVGLNEVSIALPLPEFALAPALDRLAPTFRARAVGNAELFPPAVAREVGFLDELVRGEDLQAAALERARTLAQLDGAAFRETKRRMRGPTAERVLSGLDADLESVRPYLAAREG